MPLQAVAWPSQRGASKNQPVLLLKEWLIEHLQGQIGAVHAFLRQDLVEVKADETTGCPLEGLDEEVKFWKVMIRCPKEADKGWLKEGWRRAAEQQADLPPLSYN